MPFSHLTLTASKPPPEGYPEDPETVGEHLRKARIDRGLYQRQVAEAIGVNPDTIKNWEMGRAQPALWHWPALIAFLGFVPFEVGDTLPERLRAWRRIHGVSQKRLATRLGVDARTVQSWEAGEHRPCRRHRERVLQLLTESEHPSNTSVPSAHTS